MANRGRPLVWWALVVWLLGFVWHWFRPSLGLADAALGPLMGVLYACGLLAVVVAVLRRRRWLPVLTVVPVVAALSVLVNPGWMIAPRTWFDWHRPLFDRALDTDPGDAYYGNPLPVSLRFLAVGGRVSERDGARFFPQWMGTPDDAGGYLYSPDRSPEGIDLYGSICSAPVDLGEGWWMCGLGDSRR